MDQDRSYVDLTIKKSIRPASETQLKQQEINALKVRLNTAIKSIDSIQTLLTEQAKELDRFMTDIDDELRIDNGKL